MQQFLVQLKQEFNITAKGTGAGVLKVVTLYYARPMKSDCTKYDLKVELKKERLVSYPDAQESYKVIIEVLYKDPNRDATMTILDIGLLTGFVVDENDLKDLTSGRDKYIQKFEMDKQLSERGSLIIYVDKEKRCVKFYHPVKKDGALTRLCSDQLDLCQCAEGSDPDVRENVRSFMGHANCRESFGFEEGKSYLIMGLRADLPRIADKLQYILGEQTWIEYWPTREEGQTSVYRDKYIGINGLAQTLTEFGCPS
ncbi:hypothetical protein AMELA_G00234810 [Ameiurus melas]|uniref:NTR domain-containing protein n=1 Tax=Ameiurus melas TaxID=219545 RepID=A0A7J5ZY55_AMEME|nr:hypothetical protein AMELA_G00234810 [Ameiurus melas]